MFRGKTQPITLEKYKDLFDALYPSMCLFANTYLNDMDTSKDVVQEVFIKTWEKQVPYPNYNAIKSFLYTSVKNKCLDYLKSKHYKVMVNSPILDLEQIQTEEFFLSEVATVEIYANLEKAIKTLPNKCEKIIWLSLHDLSNKEIAEELSITTSTVRTQKKIGYQKLRNALSNLNSLLTIF
jgi:RNA polymerase sigma-70 factor (ECF subfamily)